MRISDWSSDVCSSDLGPEGSQGPDRSRWRGQGRRFEGRSCQVPEGPGSGRCHGRSEVSGPCVASGKGDQPRLGAKAPGLWPLLKRPDRQSVVWGKGVSVGLDCGCSRNIKTKNIENRKNIRRK